MAKAEEPVFKFPSNLTELRQTAAAKRPFVSWILVLLTGLVGAISMHPSILEVVSLGGMVFLMRLLIIAVRAETIFQIAEEGNFVEPEWLRQIRK